MRLVPCGPDDARSDRCCSPASDGRKRGRPRKPGGFRGLSAFESVRVAHTSRSPSLPLALVRLLLGLNLTVEGSGLVGTSDCYGSRERVAFSGRALERLLSGYGAAV